MHRHRSASLTPPSTHPPTHTHAHPRRGAEALALFEELPSLAAAAAAAPAAPPPSPSPSARARGADDGGGGGAPGEAPRFGRSTASFNSALIACVECGKLDEASALLRRMRSEGVQPYPYPYP